MKTAVTKLERLSNTGAWKCKKCGECCMHLVVPPFHTAIDQLPPCEQPPDEALAEIQAHMDKLTNGRGGNIRTHTYTLLLPTSLELPCCWFDLETRRCKHYKYRPEVCRDHRCGESAEEYSERTSLIRPDKIMKDMGSYAPYVQKWIVISVLEKMTRADQKRVLKSLNRLLEQPQKDSK